MRVLVGCEFSGIVRDAFIARGHEALSADLMPSERPGPHYQGDVFDVIDYPWDLGIFHFPCTHSSVSGARHFDAKRQDGRFYVGNALWLRGWKAAAHIPRVCFEHPVSVISSLFRKPDQVVQPWMFGHGETKATCFWLRGLRPLAPTHRKGDLFAPEEPAEREARVHNMAPSETRPSDRARTFAGVAHAMADQWGSLPKQTGCSLLLRDGKPVCNLVAQANA